MEKVLQILAVFVVLLLLIRRSIRGGEGRFRRFSYLGRVGPVLGEGVAERIVMGVVGSGGMPERSGTAGEADGWLWDEDSGLMLSYYNEGRLMISRKIAGGRSRELQEMAVPMDCTGLGWDPLERKIYLQEEGDWFVYGEEG